MSGNRIRHMPDLRCHSRRSRNTYCRPSLGLENIWDLWRRPQQQVSTETTGATEHLREAEKASIPRSQEGINRAANALWNLSSCERPYQQPKVGPVSKEEPCTGWSGRKIRRKHSWYRRCKIKITGEDCGLGRQRPQVHG